MENTLSSRFTRVANRFRVGLLSVMKGAVLGLSLGLLNRLLNPIEALEEKIKNLLNQGSDIRDLADRFNTSPGQLKRLQDVAGSLGVKPDQLKEMMTKFATAVETAREEIANPFVQKSESTQAVRNFAGEKDLAEGFFKFLQSLKSEGQGQGRLLPLSENAQRMFANSSASGKPISEEEKQRLLANGEVRQLSGLESRRGFEKTIFGEQLHGPEKRLVETDFAQQFKKLNEPSAQKLTGAVNKTAGLEDQRRLLEIQNENKGFLQGADTLNLKMIKDMEAAAAKQQERLTKQLTSYDDLRRAADGIENLKEPIMRLGEFATKGLGFFGSALEWFGKPKTARDMSNAGLGGGRRER